MFYYNNRYYNNDIIAIQNRSNVPLTEIAIFSDDLAVYWPIKRGRNVRNLCR